MGDIVYALSSRNCEQKKEGLNKASNVPNNFVCFKYDKIHCVRNFNFFWYRAFLQIELDYTKHCCQCYKNFQVYFLQFN